MAFSRITNEERAGKGNVGQPDTPLLSATEMQEQMDSLPNLAIDKFNAFLDELALPDAAQNIGCTAPNGITATAETIYSVLTAIANKSNAAETLSHSHNNKAALDTLSSSDVDNLHRLVTLLSTVTEVVHFISSGSNSEIPTSLAVTRYIQTADIRSNIMNSIYPLGAIYMTTTIDPDTVFGTTGKWTLLSTDSDGIKTYKRTA